MMNMYINKHAVMSILLLICFGLFHHCFSSLSLILTLFNYTLNKLYIEFVDLFRIYFFIITS